MRGMIMIAVLVGSTVGGFVPSLWGAGVLSVAGVVFSVLGGVAGVWVGAKLSADL